MGTVLLYMANMFDQISENVTAQYLQGMEYREDCGHNIQPIVEYKSIQDNYSVEKVRRLRGPNWRGVDFDDQRAAVYPVQVAVLAISKLKLIITVMVSMEEIRLAVFCSTKGDTTYQLGLIFHRYLRQYHHLSRGHSIDLSHFHK